ncbi:arsenic transporter [Tumebacillus permanentifrigoris]|uniref:Na+/H+ antiporter NhaD/arsenite permease-like protein n=1 Tax=Tumebacillus permanentifrigoris TaxID=378543 RepID=A0A316DF80_9BACL|nr:arsenic transporter [Tumebacillus permanentifrigoris]PWK14894.1 Na+/H+ antiporter NhaD/arsenite permease-like protein [Tumebacillus permanentifrigoris]
MSTSVALLTSCTFILTTLLIFWRPRQLHEAYPAVVGAVLMLCFGAVPWADLGYILNTVSGAAVTIIATIVMANVLESLGFFHWVAEWMMQLAKGSGRRLFMYVNLLCFLMTLFFNNDGSILITTPILLILLKKFSLKPKQQIPYLMSGVLVATASSAPIGVSNIVNLIALKIVGLDLYMQTAMMFVPTLLGLVFMVGLLLWVFRRDLPRTLTPIAPHHQMRQASMLHRDRTKFMRNVFLFVFGVRISLFVGSYFGIPVAVVAVVGSLALLLWRWVQMKIPPTDLFQKAPWHIFLFAFGMYVQIYGLHHMGLTDGIISFVEPLVQQGRLDATLTMGGLVTVLSSLFNNHPGLMIGTLTLTNMHLDPMTTQLIYLANVIGSDVGSLLLPIGTLATLIWFHLLKQANIKLAWRDYVRVTVLVIPLTLLFMLVGLHLWVEWLFVS